MRYVSESMVGVPSAGREGSPEGELQELVLRMYLQQAAQAGFHQSTRTDGRGRSAQGEGRVSLMLDGGTPLIALMLLALRARPDRDGNWVQRWGASGGVRDGVSGLVSGFAEL